MPTQRSKKGARVALAPPRRVAKSTSGTAATLNGEDQSVNLTPREIEVLALYLQLLNDKKVANQLGTKVQTVRNQLASIEHKYGVRSREELVALGLSSNRR